MPGSNSFWLPPSVRVMVKPRTQSDAEQVVDHALFQRAVGRRSDSNSSLSYIPSHCLDAEAAEQDGQQHQRQRGGADEAADDHDGQRALDFSEPDRSRNSRGIRPTE